MRMNTSDKQILIVEDNNKPEVNIEDNQTYDHDLLLEIKDENDYQVYLNNNKIHLRYNRLLLILLVNCFLLFP